MDAAVRELLHRAGWYPGRAVDTGDARAALEADGFTVDASTEAFLREYQGLMVDYQRGGGPDQLLLDARMATENVDPTWAVT